MVPPSPHCPLSPLKTHSSRPTACPVRQSFCPQLAQTELLPMVAAADAPAATAPSATSLHAALQRRPRTRRGSSDGAATTLSDGAATRSDGGATRSGGGATGPDGAVRELPKAEALLPMELPLRVPLHGRPEELPTPGTVWPGSAATRTTMATAAAPCECYGRCVSFGLESGPTRHPTRHATRSPAAAPAEGTSLDLGLGPAKVRGLHLSSTLAVPATPAPHLPV